MAKTESWLKRNIVAMAGVAVAVVSVLVVWYNGNKPPPAPVAPAGTTMTAIAASGATAVNATGAAVVQAGASGQASAGAQTQAHTQPHTYTPVPTAASAPPIASMHASADTGGNAVNAAGSARVTVQKSPASTQP